HGRQALVASGHADDALARGQRADQPPENCCRVVAVGQRIHHAGGALGASVAGVADETGEGDASALLDLLRGGLHEQPNFKMSGLKAESEGPAVLAADAALRRADEAFPASQLKRIPAHAGVLGPTENVAGRSRSEDLGGQRKLSLGAG